MTSMGQRAPPPEASPYAQPHHFSLSANPDAPKTTEARRRRAAAEEVERCNAFIASRLEALKREPPSRFHAPDGDLSLKPKHKRGPKGPRAADRRKPAWDDGSSRPRTEVSADTRRRVAGTDVSNASSIVGTAPSRTAGDPAGDPAGFAPGGKVSNKPPARRTWPVRLHTSVHPTPSERREVEMQNANLRRRLANQYAAGRDSRLVREGKGRPVDGLAMWARRLAVYDAEDPRLRKGKNRATPSSRGVDPETGKCAVTGVPKTLGVARCSATGLYTYFAADGHRLKEHPDVPNLFYCEKWYDDFKRLDATMQRAIVAWHASRAKGRGADPGFGGGVSKEGTEWKPVRPACESWVVNRHMKLALTLMRRLAKGTEEGLTMRAVEARVAKCAAAEKAQDAAARAAQKAIDDDAATERAAVRAAAETTERETETEGGDRAATETRAGGKATVSKATTSKATTSKATVSKATMSKATMSKATVSAGNQSPKKLPTTSVGSGTRPSTRAAAPLAAKATGEETAA